MSTSCAAPRFLDHVPPEVRAALNRIISEGHRTSEVFDGIRALFRKVDPGRQTVDVNEIISDVLTSLRGELRDHHIEARFELMSKVALVEGNRSQLREVVFNLIRNALEAMGTMTNQIRGVAIKNRTSRSRCDRCCCGGLRSGIDPKRLGSIFDAFFTTKSHGIGLGLAICRMIIERHGGQLTAVDGKTGAKFQFVLPVNSCASRWR